jgi:hypothetical protein
VFLRVGVPTLILQEKHYWYYSAIINNNNNNIKIKIGVDNYIIIIIIFHTKKNAII